MEIKNLSTTLVSNWDQCPERAWRSYARRLELGDDNEGSNPTRFGTVVHEVLETIHYDLMIGVIDDADLDTDKIVLEYYDRAWRENACYDFDYYDEGMLKIPEFVRRSVRNRAGSTVGTEILFAYDAVFNKVYFAEDRVAIRKHVAAILAAGGVPVVSEIDRIDRISETSYEFTDYKSNILPFTRDEIENSKQLILYDIVVRLIYPEAEEVEGVYDMLRHGRFPVRFTQEHRDTLRRYLVNLWHQIDQTEAPEQRINKYCRWCEIRGNCKAYALVLDSKIQPILTDTTDTPEGMATLWTESEKLANLIKIAEERRKEITAALSAKVVQDGMGEPVKAGDREYYLIQNPRYEYNKEGVFKALEQRKSLTLLPQIMSVTKTAVDRLLKSRPELKEDLEPLVQKKFVTPTLKSRKLGGGTSTASETVDE
jgi:hypothetical protein